MCVVQQSPEKGTKNSIYLAIILAHFLYGSQSWVTYWYHLRLLERLHQCSLHTTLNIHWRDLNIEVLIKTEIINIEIILLKFKLRFAANVSIGNNYHYISIILSGELPAVHRHRRDTKEAI